MTFQELASTKEFQNLHPVKQQIIREFFRNGIVSSPESLLPQLMTINKELYKRNLSFTREESKLLIQLLRDTLTSEEQQRIDMILGLFFP